MPRWYRPVTEDPAERYWRCTPSAERTALADPAHWYFLDTTSDAIPSAVNEGFRLTAIVDPPALKGVKTAAAPMMARATRATRQAMAHRFINRPLAILPSVAHQLYEAIDRNHVGDDGGDYPTPDAGYDVIEGVALIAITGILVHGRTFWWDETDYGSIATAIGAAARDRDVRAIALQIESPGGEVSGVFDLADTIYEARGRKPIWAIVDDYAFSAAYAIASATDYVTVSRTGGVGSVGVVTMHLDVSRMLDDIGVTPSLIFHGRRKVDFSPLQPLSDSARARLQIDVDRIGAMFDGLVARNRGIPLANVIGAQAATFLGSAGIDVGFADGLMPPATAFATLREQVRKGTIMTPSAVLRAGRPAKLRPQKPARSATPTPAAKPTVQPLPAAVREAIHNDQAEETARRMVLAASKARNEPPPKFVRGPRQSLQTQATALAIVNAARKAKGLAPLDKLEVA